MALTAFICKAQYGLRRIYRIGRVTVTLMKGFVTTVDLG